MQLFKKTITSFVFTAFVATSLFFALFTAQEVKAVGVELMPINVSEQALRGKSCGMAVFGLCVPFTSLDSFAYFIAKVMIQQLTASIVNWINTGFEGNPSFVTDPAGFFTDIVDQEIGKMIEGGSLNALCSPFNISIRLALAFKYRPFQQKISCTLTDVIRNSQNAITGASINGFTAGDFKQGGWPAFASMTEEPQNNTYGAYLEAENQLEISIANHKIISNNEISQGKGFLSWKKCTEYATGSQSSGNTSVLNTGGADGADVPADPSSSSASGSTAKKGDCLHEEVQTPGTVIESQLENQLGSGVRQLELADSFNEIVNALVAQLVKQVLTAGLHAASGNGASDTNAYINQLQNDQATQAAQLKAIKDNVTPSLNSAIANETAFKNNKTETVNQLINAKTLLTNVKMCYADKLPTLTVAQAAIAQQRMNDVDQTISTKINPLAQPLLNDINTVTSNMTILTQVQQGLVAAQTANDAYYPTQSFSTLTQSNTLHTTQNITTSATERAQVTANMQALNTDTNIKLQECQLFPN